MICLPKLTSAEHFTHSESEACSLVFNGTQSSVHNTQTNACLSHLSPVLNGITQYNLFSSFPKSGLIHTLPRGWCQQKHLFTFTKAGAASSWLSVSFDITTFRKAPVFWSFVCFKKHTSITSNFSHPSNHFPPGQNDVSGHDWEIACGWCSHKRAVNRLKLLQYPLHSGVEKPPDTLFTY